MAISNGYTTLALLKAAIGIPDDDWTDNVALENAVEAASRQIDDYCGKGRKFWQDGSVVARKFYPRDIRRVYVDDISTVTGLIVKVDADDDGTFETTLTINTHFIVEPVNAAAEYPVQPFTSIKLLSASTVYFQALDSGRPNVEVTAKYGWVAVPDAIERACIMQARQVFKQPDSNLLGGLQAGIDGQVLRIPAIDPMARSILNGFVRYLDVDDGTTDH